MLYKKLAVYKSIIIVRFINDINIMIASLSAKNNCAGLKKA